MIPDIVQQIIDLFNGRGSESYGTEAVTQAQHAIQSAMIAQNEGAAPHLVVAALLHDIGHILGNAALPTDSSESYDDHHELRGYRWLLEHFGSRVADPVRLHVAAKRYLCTTEPEYCQLLSPTSLRSFHDQGGCMSPQELDAFEAEPYFAEALQIRKWDDQAKDPNAALPKIEQFVDLLVPALISKA